MRKLTNSIAVLLAALVLCTNVQCKKEDKKTKTELLTSGKWHVTAFTADPGFDWDNDGNVSTDIYAQYEACEKDDYLVFKTDGTYEANQGATKCNADDDQTDTGTWAFTDNESKIVMDGETYTIEELTKNNFRIKYADATQVLVITLGK